MPLIPESFVYGSMFYLSFMGFWCSRQKIFLDPIYFVIFIPQAFMFIFFDIFPIPVEVRAVYVRLSLALVPLCLALILTSQYWRRRKWMM